MYEELLELCWQVVGAEGDVEVANSEDEHHPGGCGPGVSHERGRGCSGNAHSRF